MDDGQGARGASDPWEFEVFPTGSTIARAPDDPASPVDGHTMSERLRRSGAVVRDGYEHARDFHARPGHRPGGSVAATSNREGGDTDIVRPVLVDPLVACGLAVSGSLFVEPVPHFDIVHRAHDPSEERYLVWEARVTSDQGRGVAATLHLLASPSMVVTVLELIPRQRLRWNRDRFVRDGVLALDVLARRLERARPRHAA